jgi:hypothetical protein
MAVFVAKIVRSLGARNPTQRNAKFVRKYKQPRGKSFQQDKIVEGKIVDQQRWWSNESKSEVDFVEEPNIPGATNQIRKEKRLH